MAIQGDFEIRNIIARSPSTRPPLRPLVRQSDLTDTRSAINAVRAAAHLPAYTWSANGTFLSAALLTELRNALNAALDQLATLDPSLGRPPYVDPVLNSGDPVRAVHIQQLRDRMQ
jgi:hypothetical protein